MKTVYMEIPCSLCGCGIITGKVKQYSDDEWVCEDCINILAENEWIKVEAVKEEK